MGKLAKGEVLKHQLWFITTEIGVWQISLDPAELVLLEA